MICQRYVAQVLKPGLAGEWSHYPFAFGQYSDDSQLARELIQSLLACKGFDPEDYAHRIALLFKHHKIVGEGQATQAAAHRLLQGVPWNKAGALPPSAGNGSAMRAAPLGLYFYNDPEPLVAASRQQSMITHQDPRCAAGSAVIAAAVSLALQQETVDAHAWIGGLAQTAEKIDLAFAEQLEKLEGWLALPPEEAEPLIAQAGIDPEYETHWHGISPFVTSSVLWSLYAFLKSPEDYWETVCAAIAVGGDVDTTAAMAGAISGSFLGMTRIPGRLLEKLTDQGVWGLEQLRALSDQLFDLKHALA